MKLKSIGLSLTCALLFLIGTASGASAATVDSDASAVTVQPYGAGSWDNIGTWTFSKMISFNSGGGDLKVCVNNSTSKVKFDLNIYPVSPAVTKTTSGGSPNCAVWTVGVPARYELWNAYSTATWNVTVYD